jgi:Kdo2-lipid IVA lauroyltransferase/acyltransferase
MSRRKPRPKPYSPRLWGSWLAVAVAWLLARLPLPWLLGLGRAFGLTAYRLARRRRHIARVNVALCFPERSDAEREALVRQSFMHTGVSLAEMILVWLNPGHPVAGRFRVHGAEHLAEAQARGHGVLLVAGHFSCLDIVSQPISERFSLDVMYRENKNPVWEWLQVQGRRRYFDAVIEREDTRQALRSLKQGHTLWYAADQDYGRKHSVFAPFFGVPAASITATARLARFNDSPVVLMTQFRDLDAGTWELNFHPAIDDFPSGNDLADATRINGLIEQAIRRHPEQYLWVHRRFKTRPPGAPDPYRLQGD